MARNKQLKQYIISAKNQNDLNSLIDEFSNWGVSPTYIYKNVFFGFCAKLTGLLFNWYKDDPRIIKIEESVQYELFTVQSNAPLHLDRLDQRSFPLSGSYTFSADGTGVTAYVIDTGIVYINFDDSKGVALGEFGGRALPLEQAGFPGKILDPSADLLEIEGKSVPFPRGWDESGHGTHVAGILGSQTYGVAKNVTIKSAKVFTRFNVAFSGDIIAGIDAVLEDYNDNGQPPSVCNMSLGQTLNLGDPETSVEVAVKSMTSAGITVVAAAGNSGIDTNRVSPARLDEVITVGAVDQLDRIADFSNFQNNEDIIAPGDFGSVPSAQTNTGSAVDIFAPGVGITSTYLPITLRDGTIVETAIFSGTSMASPIVAGVAALVLENSPTLTSTQVKSEIIDGATTGIISGNLNEAPNLLVFSVFVDHAIDWITPAGSLGSFDEGFSINAQLDADGAIGQPIMYSLVEGSLPTGITLNGSTGLISGTAPIIAVDTTFNFTIRASDNSVFSNRTFSITVTQADLPPTWLTVSDLGSVEESENFTIQLSAISNNGLPNSVLSYAAITDLPEGWLLSELGSLSGIAPQAVNNDIQVQFQALVTDGLSSATQEFTITVRQRFEDTSPPRLPEWTTEPGNIGVAIEGQSFSTFVQALDQDGIPLPVTYHLDIFEDGSQFGPFGRLPPGLQLNSTTGEISGTINGLVGLGNPSTFDGETFLLDGGTTTFDQNSQALPGSLTSFDNNDLMLDGGLTSFDINISSIGFEFEFAIYVSDGANIRSRLFSITALTLEPNQPPVWITETGVIGVFDGLDPVNAQIIATDPNGGPLPLKYSIVGGNLPGGLSLNTLTGEIIGIAQNVEAQRLFTFVARVTDGIETVDRTFSIIINKTNNPPEWITPSGIILEINEGQFLNLQLVSQDPENDDVYYTVIGGSLPPNVTLNQDTGLLSGTILNVDQDTDYTFTVRVDDSKSNLLGEELFVDREFTIRVLDGALNLNKPPFCTTPSGVLLDATENQPYFFQLEANDPDNSPNPLTYNLVGGFLPQGLALNINTGVISGFPNDNNTTDDTSVFIIRLSDGISFVDRTFSITVLDVSVVNLPPTWITPGTPQTLGQFPELNPLVIGLQATDPEGDDLTFSIVSGLFPPGLNLNSDNGIIDGIPLNVVSDTVFVFTVRVSDPQGAFEDREFSIEILNVPNQAPVWITPPGLLGSFNEQQPLTIALQAIDPDVGPNNLSYNVTLGSLPPGLSLDTNTGIISGIPSDVAIDTLFTFGITVDDGLAFIDRTFEMEILDVPVFTGPTTELSVALTGPNKLEWKSWNDNTLIPDDALFNPTDPNFGRVGVDPANEFPKIFVTNGLHTNDQQVVFNLFGPHHMTFRVLIGLLDFAVVRNTSGDIIYEVIFQRIVDLQRGSDFNILTSPTPSSLDTNGPETYISKNFEHLRTELQALSNSENLPDWMTSEQTLGDPNSVIGYIPAIELAFVNPNRANAIVEQANQIQVNEITIPGLETTFDLQDIRGNIVDPTVNIGDSIIIDGITVTMTGTTLVDAINDINSAGIAGISASLTTGSQFIPGPFNGSQLVFGNVLLLSYNNPTIILSVGSGTALADLGFTPGIKTQTIFDLNTTTFDFSSSTTIEVVRGLGHQFVGRFITIDRYLFEDTLGNTAWLKFRSDTQDPNWITPPGLIASLDFSTLAVGNPIPTITVQAESPVSTPIEYFVVSGSLPDGLILNSSNGEINGTIPSFGSTVIPFTSHFVIRAQDTNGLFSDRGFDIRINGTSFDVSSMTLDGATTSFDVT